jgi:hypothetical protein
MKHQRLSVLRTPVFEVDLRAILARDPVPGLSPSVRTGLSVRCRRTATFDELNGLPE